MNEPQSLPPPGGPSAQRRVMLAAVAVIATLCLGIAGAERAPQVQPVTEAKTIQAPAPKPAPTPAAKPRVGAPAPAVTHRVADASRAPALFAPHSWHVDPPVVELPPAPPAPPPPPTAPPLPYNYVGQYTPQGDATVYFLANADRVIDAHIGDQLDGVYTFESADASQLIFNYMPLNIRQTLPVGAKP